MATGNTARVYKLPVGVIEPGREADMCIVDAPIGSVGKTALEAVESRRSLRYLHGADRRADQDRTEPEHASRGSRGGGFKDTDPLEEATRPLTLALSPEGRGDRSLPLLFEGEGGQKERTMRIRKMLTVMEEIYEDGGKKAAKPIKKVAAVAVIENPFAGRYVEDLEELVKTGEELGDLLGRRATAALGAPVHSYGKAAIVDGR